MAEDDDMGISTTHVFNFIYLLSISICKAGYMYPTIHKLSFRSLLLSQQLTFLSSSSSCNYLHYHHIIIASRQAFSSEENYFHIEYLDWMGKDVFDNQVTYVK